jgi:hypothetical protein
MQYSTALEVAFQIVIDLAKQNVADQLDHPNHHKQQEEAINMIEDLDATAKAEKESAGLDIAGINVRFFCQAWDDMNGGDYVAEIDESTFVSLGGCVTYDRTTVRDHGCHQIGLTTDAILDE